MLVEQTVAFDLNGLPYIETIYRGDNEQKRMDQDNVPDFPCGKYCRDNNMDGDFDMVTL